MLVDASAMATSKSARDSNPCSVASSTVGESLSDDPFSALQASSSRCFALSKAACRLAAAAKSRRAAASETFFSA